MSEREPRGGGGRLPYMPGIDALRAGAVLGVFFYHADTGGWMPGGFLGVDVFFVISGYLITALLLSELRDAGHLDVLGFWNRRARRLLPAVGALVAITLVIAAIFISSEVAGLRGDALASLLYVNNWHLVLSEQSYFQEFARPSLFRHLWSLSVEEQFYLLWPLLFAAGMTVFGRRRVLIGVIVGMLVSAALMWALFDPGSDPIRAYYGSDTRASGLLAGAALAFLWHPDSLTAPLPERFPSWGLDAIGVVALILVLRDFLGTHDFDPSLYHGGFLLLAVSTAVLVGVLAHPVAYLGKLLAQPPVLWLGKRSYSFYLWHWPVLALTRPGIDVPLHGLGLTALQLAVVLGLAHLSYTYVEQPLRRPGGMRKPDVVRLGRSALAASVIVVVFLVGWSGIVATGGTSQSRAASARVQGRATERSATDRNRFPSGVLAVGDSVMVGATSSLVARLGPQLTLNAAISRSAADVITILRRYRAAGDLPQKVIVQVGANGPISREERKELTRVLRGVPRSYLVNVLVTRGWQDESNRALQEVAKALPNATLIDWHGAAEGRDNLTDDGTHLTTAGQALYSSLIARAVKGDNHKRAVGGPTRQQTRIK